MTALLHSFAWLRMVLTKGNRRHTVEQLARRLGASRKQAKRIAYHF